MSDETPIIEAAAPAPEPGTTATPEPADNSTPEEAELPKTFTQEELDEIVSKRLAKAERKLRRELQQAQEAQRHSPTEAPDPDEFTDVDSYAEALANHKAELILAQREMRQQQAKLQTTYEEREDAARERYNDFHQVVYKQPVDGGPSITPAMLEVIMESDQGPEIAYHLGKNVELSRRIARLSPLSQARELGLIEATLKESRPARRTSSAPEPIKPVGSRASTPSYSASDPRSDSLPISEWMARRNQELRARG